MSESGSLKTKLIGIVLSGITTALVGVFTPLGDYVKDVVFPSKAIVNGYIKIKADPAAGLNVILDKQQEFKTGNDGFYAFDDVRAGIHSIEVYRSASKTPSVYSFVVKKGVTEHNMDEINLSPPKLVSNTISINDQPMEDLHEEYLSNPNEDAHHDATTSVKHGSSTSASIGDLTSQVAIDDTMPVVSIDYSSLSAKEIMDLITVEVKIDYDNPNKDKLYPFNYYLSAEPQLLDRIETANYIRDHHTFPEAKKKDKFISKYDRTTSFSFKSYQWGWINNVILNIVLLDGNESGWIRKKIDYVNLDSKKFE